MTVQNVFSRVEKKYLLSSAQQKALIGRIGGRLRPDPYGRTRINSLYYDTPDWRLLRASIEKPVYREKLRLRSYGAPNEESVVYCELKRKVKDIVYKRREGMPYALALRYLRREALAPEQSQITREIDWFLAFYGSLRPSILISCDRVALYGREEGELRLTFDRDIRWESERPILGQGTAGRTLLEPGQTLLEIKIPGAMPFWLARELDDLAIYPIGFSKVGNAYRELMRLGTAAEKGDVNCA